jgi:hypothetical protein
MLYCYEPSGSVRAVNPDYQQQDGEILLDHTPPLPGEVPSYDAAMAALATTAATSALVAQAQDALNKSDVTMLRQWEEGNPPPAAWAAYRAALRLVVKTGTGPLPVQPAFPA